MTRFVPALLVPALLCAQSAANLPTNALLSEPGPTFQFYDSQLPNPLTFIAYGDQRFTDPTNVKSANPGVRQWLANQIAAERPAAVILNGDVPLNGDVKNDYEVFRSETKAWRDAHLRVFPALGNHEFAGPRSQAGAGKLVEQLSGAAKPALVFGAARFSRLRARSGQRRISSTR